MALRKRSPKVTPTENPRVSEAGSSAAAPVGRPAPTPVAKRRVGGVAAAVALAAFVGGRPMSEVGLVALTVGLGQAILGWHNDIVDRDFDARVDRKSVV